MAAEFPDHWSPSSGTQAMGLVGLNWGQCSLSPHPTMGPLRSDSRGGIKENGEGPLPPSNGDRTVSDPRSPSGWTESERIITHTGT